MKTIPRWTYEHDGWEIEFFPIAKSPEMRGNTEVRPIGFQYYGLQGRQDLSSSIKKSISKKTNRYGDFDKPYVIAVNVLNIFADESDVKNALFGELFCKVIHSESGLPLQYKPARKPNGIWISKSGPINTRVSAVLFTKRLTPWNIPRAKIRLYHNPWAKKPYSSVLNCLPQMVPQNDELKLIDGENLGKIFGFSFNWPEDNP